MHIVVGTPCYGGMMCTEYTKSLLAFNEACLTYDIKLTSIFLGNESLIQRARNSIAHLFLKTDAQYLIFIDADQKFEPNDIAKMIKSKKGIIGGAVPMKGINWEKIRKAALNNKPDLSKLGGIFNVNTLPDHPVIDENTPFQVRHVGTGFMLIDRQVFDTLKPDVGWYYKDNEKVYDFFQVRNVNHELLSEDYNFCEMYREKGGTVWVAPWCKLGHFGAYCFEGQLAKELE